MSKESTRESGARRDALCSVGGCPRKARYKKSGWCQTHYHRWWRHGNHEFVKHERGEGGPKAWWDVNASYRASHARVAYLWGKAKEYACYQCSAPAAEWSYDGKDPDEREASMHGSPVVYSVWPEFYAPMCKRCHRRKDGAVRAGSRTHCIKGHELTDENTYIQPKKPTQKNCRECRRLEGRLRKRRKLDAARVARGEEPKWKDQA